MTRAAGNLPRERSSNRPVSGLASRHWNAETRRLPEPPARRRKRHTRPIQWPAVPEERPRRALCLLTVAGAVRALHEYAPCSRSTLPPEAAWAPVADDLVVAARTRRRPRRIISEKNGRESGLSAPMARP
jgi:hypothetical protein